jgi:hypothetical protein
MDGLGRNAAITEKEKYTVFSPAGPQVRSNGDSLTLSGTPGPLFLLSYILVFNFPFHLHEDATLLLFLPFGGQISARGEFGGLYIQYHGMEGKGLGEFFSIIRDVGVYCFRGCQGARVGIITETSQGDHYDHRPCSVSSDQHRAIKGSTDHFAHVFN